MKKETSKRHKVPAHPSPTGGIRKRYRKLMSGDRFRFPRKRPLTHSIGWYLEGDGPLARPTMGIYAMACYAEYMLHRARTGCGVPEREATEFFAATRRAMQNVLSTFSIGGRLAPSGRGTVRRKVAELMAKARALDAVSRDHGPRPGELSKNSHLTPLVVL